MHSWRYPQHFHREVMLANQPERRRGWTEDQFHTMWDLPIQTYLSEMGDGVDRALLLGLKARDTLGLDIDNMYLAQLARSYPDKLSWGCCVVLTDPSAPEEVERCATEFGAVALGEISPGYGNYRLDDPRCFPVYEVARSLDLPLVVHAGFVQARFGRLKYTDLVAVDEVAIQFPELKIVLCHLGYPQYEQGAFLVAKHENVYGDISWLPQLGGQDRRILSRYLPKVEYPYFHLAFPLLYYFSQTFGIPDKLLWGSDFPACSPPASRKSIREVNKWLAKADLPTIPDQSLDRIFEQNWRLVFTKIDSS